MLDKRDGLLAKLAKSLGLCDDAAIARVAQLKQRAPDKSFDALAHEAGLIDGKQRTALVRAFNEKVKELRAGGAKSSGSGSGPAPAPQRRPSSIAAERGIEDSGVIGFDGESSDTALPPPAKQTPSRAPQRRGPDLIPDTKDDGLAAAFSAPPVTPADIDRAASDASRFLARGGPLELKEEGARIRNSDSDVQHVVEPPRGSGSARAPKPISSKSSHHEDDGGDLAVPDDDDEEARLLAEPTLILKDEENAPKKKKKSAKLAPEDEEKLLAEPTMILRDDEKQKMQQEDEAQILAEPTIILGEEAEKKKSGGLDPEDEAKLLAEPTLVLGNEAKEERKEDDDGISDENLQLAGSATASASARQKPMPGVKSKKGGVLDREEFKRRTKMRLGFEGMTLGDYEILSEISRGAFGVVLKARPGGMAKTLARERGFEGDVAMKVMLETKDPEETRRFMDEVKILIALQHPNIIKIFDAGCERGLTFYTMELVNGLDTRSLVRDQGVPPLLLSVRIAKDVAHALATVHQQTVYHRDIKPTNVMIDRSCQPYRTVLIDFGLVQKKGKDEGLVMGTPSYMPPEQAKPKGGFGEVNATSDIYALGATFFFLLTGRPPFSGNDPKLIIKAVVSSDPPDPCSINAEIPRKIADICLKCLQKGQRDRYTAARLLADDLERELKNAQLKLKAKSVWGKLFGSGGGAKS